MRHLHFVQSIEPLEGGGLGRAAVDLHRALAAAGAGSSLVTTCRGVPPPAPAGGVAQFHRSAPSKAYFSPSLWKAAGAMVAGCDVVHGHGFYTGVNWALGRAARQTDRPLVYHPHGMLEPWILGRSRGKKTLAHWLFESANFAHARLWRALTEREASQIRGLGIKAPVVVAPNGIDVTAFDAPAPAIEKERKVILFLGRIHPKKGLPLLLSAWAGATGFHASWEIVIAGPDEEGHRAQLEAQIAGDGIGNLVRFVGVVGGVEKIAWLQAADLFVLPSHSEGFSVAILESLASRTPVLATHACNFPEIESTGAGWLCDAAAGSLGRSLNAALSADDAERSQRGLAGRALVERDYTWSAIARKLIDATRAHIT
jgi:glycosyltransferase involved in cell wall biosynthesis